jgi:hypothetical protein
MLVAYRLGVEQLGLFAGIGYGIFDAWIVIWQRERISLVIHRTAGAIRSVRVMPKKKVAPLPWMIKPVEQTVS